MELQLEPPNAKQSGTGYSGIEADNGSQQADAGPTRLPHRRQKNFPRTYAIATTEVDRTLF